MPRAQARLKRFLARQVWADNGRLAFDIPKDYDLEAVLVRVSGTAVVTTNYTAVRAEAPMQAVKLVTLKANGSDQLDAIPGIQAHRLGLFRRGQLAPVNAPAGFVIASYPFDFSFVLDRVVIDGIRPKDGAFPGRGLTSFQLEFLMGQCGDLFTGAGVGTITGGLVEVSVIQSAESVGADGKLSLPRVVTKRSHVDIPFPASNNNYQQRLNSGSLTRGVMLRTSGAVTIGEPSNAVLNNVRVQVGNESKFDLPAAHIRIMNACDYDVTSVPTGIYIVDFMAFGGPVSKLSDALNLNRGEDVFMFLDVTGGANVAIGLTTMEYSGYSPKYWGLRV